METRTEFSALAVTVHVHLFEALPSVVHRPQTCQRPVGPTASTHLSDSHHVPIDNGDPGRRIDGRNAGMMNECVEEILWLLRRLRKVALMKVKDFRSIEWNQPQLLGEWILLIGRILCAGTLSDAFNSPFRASYFRLTFSSQKFAASNSTENKFRRCSKTIIRFSIIDL